MYGRDCVMQSNFIINLTCTTKESMLILLYLFNSVCFGQPDVLILEESHME
jgi:hypothetical protein